MSRRQVCPPIEHIRPLERGRAVGLWKLDGYILRIAAYVWHNVSVVCCYFQQWSVEHPHTRRSGSGRPHSTDSRQDRRIVRIAVAARTASREDIRAYVAHAVSYLKIYLYVYKCVSLLKH